MGAPFAETRPSSPEQHGDEIRIGTLGRVADRISSQDPGKNWGVAKDFRLCSVFNDKGHDQPRHKQRTVFKPQLLISHRVELAIAYLANLKYDAQNVISMKERTPVL